MTDKNIMNKKLYITFSEGDLENTNISSNIDVSYLL